MVRVSGTLVDFVEDPSIVAQVQVRAREVRPHGDGVMLDHPVKVEWDPPTGTVTFDAAAGTAGVIMWHAVGRSHASGSLPIVVPDGDTATLRECVEAVMLADEFTLNALERLALEISEGVARVGTAVQVGQWAQDAHQAAIKAEGHATRAENVATSTSWAGDQLTVNGQTSPPLTGPQGPQGLQGIPGPVLDVTDSTQYVAKSYVDSVNWDKGILPSSFAGTLANLAAGHYRIFDTTLVTRLGLPHAALGTLDVEDFVASAGTYRRLTWTTFTSNTFTQHVASVYAGNYSNLVWQQTGSAAVAQANAYTDSVNWYKTPLSAAFSGTLADLDPGIYGIFNTTLVQRLGLPVVAGGYLEVVDITASKGVYRNLFWRTGGGVTPLTQHMAYVYNNSYGNLRWRSLDQGAIDAATAVVSGKADAWTVEPEIESLKLAVNYAAKATDVEGVVATTYQSTRTNLMNEFHSRKPWTQTTAKAVLALTYDHGTTNFRDRLWPALRERGLPASMALPPHRYIPPGNYSTMDLATVDELKAMISEGLEISAHTWDHLDATGYADIYKQIVSAKYRLEELLDTKVESFIQTGYPTQGWNYDGFGTGWTKEIYNSTLAGRLLLQTYPVITGMDQTTKTYPLAGAHMQDKYGWARYMVEKKGDIDILKSYVTDCIATGQKMITFSHPYALTGGVNESMDDYILLLDWIVGLRDAGDLEVVNLTDFYTRYK